MGYTTQNIKNGSTACLTARFADVANGKSGIKIKNFTKSDKMGKGADATKGSADKIYVWNGGSYDIYFYHTSNEWRKDGEDKETEDAIAFGTAFFYKKGALSGANTTTSGEIANDATFTVNVKNGSTTFLAYPWPVECTLEQIGNSFAKRGTGADSSKGSADKIYKWNGGSYDIYFWHTSKAWYKDVDGVVSPVAEGSVVFGPMEGFFVKKGAMAGGNITFNRPF